MADSIIVIVRRRSDVSSVTRFVQLWRMSPRVRMLSSLSVTLPTWLLSKAGQGIATAPAFENFELKQRHLSPPKLLTGLRLP